MEKMMADQNKTDAQAAAEAPAKIVEAVAKTTDKIVETNAKAVKTARAKTRRAATKAKKTTRRATAPESDVGTRFHDGDAIRRASRAVADDDR